MFTVVGSINADLYVRLARIPVPGETLPGRDAAMRPGGKGANQATAAARLGVPVRFVGQVGDDAYAPVLRAELRANGVDDSLLLNVSGPSGQAMIMLQDDGENAIILSGGANQQWAGGLPVAAAASIAASQVLLLQREIPEAINQQAAAAAQAAGVPVVLDAGGADTPLDPAWLAQVAVLSPNETELARLTGLDTSTDAAVQRATRALLAQGVGAVLVKLGSRGSVLLATEAAPISFGVFAADVVDTTGAGDCFTAAYAVALAEGRPAFERLRFAAAAAALCIGKLGAMPAMPERAAVEALLGYDRRPGMSKEGTLA